jgi:hypothetical protein
MNGALFPHTLPPCATITMRQMGCQPLILDMLKADTTKIIFEKVNKSNA